LKLLHPSLEGNSAALKLAITRRVFGISATDSGFPDLRTVQSNTLIVHNQ